MQGGASSSHHYDMKHEMDDSDDLSGEWSPVRRSSAFLSSSCALCRALPSFPPNSKLINSFDHFKEFSENSLDLVD